MTVEELVGQNVRERRKRRGMTQEGLGAELEQYLGRAWSRQAVSQAESGQRAFPASELLALTLALECTVNHLLNPPGLDGSVTLPGGFNLDFDDWPYETTMEAAYVELQQIKEGSDVVAKRLKRVTDLFEHMIAIYKTPVGKRWKDREWAWPEMEDER
jgi:transcriptional regulator with XRE-family HTH domain